MKKLILVSGKYFLALIYFKGGSAAYHQLTVEP